MANEAEKWKSVRAKGMAHHILVRGLLAWGLPMFCVMTFVVNRPSPDALLSPRNYILFSILLWSAAGAAFGFVTWRIGESRYKKSLEKKDATSNVP